MRLFVSVQSILQVPSWYKNIINTVLAKCNVITNSKCKIQQSEVHSLHHLTALDIYMQQYSSYYFVTCSSVLKACFFQVQWNTNPQGQPAGSYSAQGLLSPTYGSATYSFTADFRPPQENPVISSSYKPVPVNFASSRRKYNFGTTLEEDGQKPNVCRICGK